MTRADALRGLAALSALPVMPTIAGAPNVRILNAGRDLTALVGATALVGSDLTPLPDSVILLRGQSIEAVARRDSVAIPESAFRIDLSGRYVMPGLIDSHIHFFQSGGLYTRPDAIDLRSVRPYTDELEWVHANLSDTFARYLRAGITSVVDVGGPFWNYDVRTQASRTNLSPRVMAAGPLISSVERSILDPNNDPPIVKIDSVDAAKKLIDRQLAARTDFVKFWWIVTPEHPAQAFRPIAQPAIEYAHSRGARVVIHATELETARLAVESGTDILAHSVFDADVDDAFLELVKARNVIYIPTLIVVGNYGYTFAGRPNLTANDLRVANPDIVATLFNMTDVESALPAETLERIRQRRAPAPPHAAMRNLRRVHDAGIRIAAGTDAGNIGTLHASSFYDEALEMVASGLTAKQVLLTATSGGAAMMGRNDLGRLAPGTLADLVVLRENPLSDIAALGSVQFVIKDGRLFETATITNEAPEQIVQRQVNAYNHHDATVFAQTYGADGVVMRPSGYVRTREAIEATYATLFAANPNVHVEILNRTVKGNVVVDKESITGFADGSTRNATVSYTVDNGSIARAEAQT
ncbi:MAG TPA: amidohydrolase family protein [Candidatus Cybelea sp.]